MAIDEKLAQAVREILKGHNATEKRMFGGIGFMVKGKMCVSVNNRPDHIVMVRIDPANEEAVQRKGASIAVMKGKIMPGWIFLQKEAIKTDTDLAYWIKLALDFNKTIT